MLLALQYFVIANLTIIIIIIRRRTLLSDIKINLPSYRQGWGDYRTTVIDYDYYCLRITKFTITTTLNLTVIDYTDHIPVLQFSFISIIVHWSTSRDHG